MDAELIATANFDLLSPELDVEDIQIGDELTPEQIENLENAMEQLNTGDPVEKDADFEAFEKQSKTSRHANVTDKDLDAYEYENKMKATHFQTKWAVKVFKGKYELSSVKFFLYITNKVV